MGTLGGALKPFAASDLAAALLRDLLRGLDPAALGGLILGQAVPAGCGPDPAGLAARAAGLPEGLPAFTVNQGAASGLRAILLAASELRGGAGGLILAGGMESASSAPFLLPTARWGTRMGAAPILDALLQDGQDLPEAAADPAARDWLRDSRARHQAAWASGDLRRECPPLTLQGPRGPVTLAEDAPLPDPAAWGAFGDGAALLLLGSGEALGGSEARRGWEARDDSERRDGSEAMDGSEARRGWEARGDSERQVGSEARRGREARGDSGRPDGSEALGAAKPLGDPTPLRGPKPLARIVASAQGPDAMAAIRRVLAAARLDLADIGRFEVDDRLPAPFLDLLARLPARVNTWGGGLAMGLPLGAAGARMVVSLAHQLQAPSLRYGLAVMASHGSGLALLLESP